MKLHLGVDATTGEVAAHALTDGHADDAAQVPELLRQSEGEIASLTADGAYDGDPATVSTLDCNIPIQSPNMAVCNIPKYAALQKSFEVSVCGRHV